MAEPQYAIEYEQDIARRAREIWKASDPEAKPGKLTPDLFLRLWPLLCEPIPEGFIQTVGKTEGKPYPSTGIRSVQVQIDRMNNVLTPLHWRDEAHYEAGGKLCTVTVRVGNFGRLIVAGQYTETSEILASASSRGGVERGSSTGNVYKGSYTNAAKLAFARLGVGHEVYLGAADFDPDVDEEAAGEKPETITSEIAKGFVDRAWKMPEVKQTLRLAASHAAGGDVGDCSTKAKATKALSILNYPQAQKVDEWLTKKEGGGS